MRVKVTIRQGWGQISTAGSGSLHARQPKNGRCGQWSRKLWMERYSAEGPRAAESRDTEVQRCHMSGLGCTLALIGCFGLLLRLNTC